MTMLQTALFKKCGTDILQGKHTSPAGKLKHTVLLILITKKMQTYMTVGQHIAPVSMTYIKISRNKFFCKYKLGSYLTQI